MAGSKKCAADQPPKRKAVRTTIEMKKEIIAKFESGTRVGKLAVEYNMPRSTITSILKIKDAIKAARVAKGVTILAANRSPLLDEVEQLLLLWIHQKQVAGENLSELIICEKAKQLCEDLQRDKATGDPINFKASSGWFRNFKTRTGFDQSGVIPAAHGEPGVSSNAVVEEAQQFALDFKNLVDAEEYLPQQVFTCEETGIFWKKMPRRTYIAEEETALPGHKPMKDRVTLLLCGNASGDCKIKPLLVYHSENPRAFKKKRVVKSELQVMWRANSKGRVTRQLFLEWVQREFVPSAKAYLRSVELPASILLIVDRPGLDDVLAGFVRVKYLPPSASPLLRPPVDQRVTSTFKHLYTKALFQHCSEVTSETELTLREFWKRHFNILHGVRLIDKAWSEVSRQALRWAWKKLWPAVSVSESDGFFQQHAAPVLVDEIVCLGLSMGLEIDNADVETLVEEHRIELTTKELSELRKEQEAEAFQEVSFVGEEDVIVPAAEIEEWLSKWEEMQGFIEKWHPNSALVTQRIDAFDEEVFGHFRKVLKKQSRSKTNKQRVNSLIKKKKKKNGNAL